MERDDAAWVEDRKMNGCGKKWRGKKKLGGYRAKGKWRRKGEVERKVEERRWRVATVR